MAAAPASRPNENTCTSCGSTLEGHLAAHVCGACGTPQPLKGGEDYFFALGAPRRLGQDRAALEKRFYEISRALHPDRFMRASPDARRASMERMSFVNEVYRTLRDADATRDYLLKTEGLAAPAKAQVPMELAEDWFEAQESPEGLEAFDRKLRGLLDQADAELVVLDQRIDQSIAASGRADRALLEQAVSLIQNRSYLRSMARDVERVRK